MFTRPGTSHVWGICEAELRKAFQKSEGLLLRVMGLRASTSAANADGSSNEETRVLMHLDQVGAAAGPPMVSWESTHLMRQAPKILVPQNKCITEPEVSGWYLHVFTSKEHPKVLKPSGLSSFPDHHNIFLDTHRPCGKPTLSIQYQPWQGSMNPGRHAQCLW